MLFNRFPVVVRGGGDLASGVIYRLVKAGFPVIVTELAQPSVIRRTVAFASAMFDGQITVEGLTARRVDQVDDVAAVLAAGRNSRAGRPMAATSRRAAAGDRGRCAHGEAQSGHDDRDDAPLVIALGPGFEAGHDCHAVIETNRGHSLGRVIWQGAAEPNTGQPGSMQGRSADRVLRAPADGFVVAQADDWRYAASRVRSIAAVG